MGTGGAIPQPSEDFFLAEEGVTQMQEPWQSNRTRIIHGPEQPAAPGCLMPGDERMEFLSLAGHKT